MFGVLATGLILAAPAQAATPPIVQQVGRDASGCDATHGWTPSWAQWMNGGKGGDVCTRTLIYSQSAGKWVVGAAGSNGQYAPVPNVTV